MRRVSLAMALLFALIGLPHLVVAEDVRIVTWNVKDIFSLSDVTARTSDLQQAAATLQPDILLIQEITSHQIALAIRDAMGLTGFHVETSDFVQSDGANRNSFEVAIISRFLLDEVIEGDPSPDNQNPGEPPEVDVEPLNQIGIDDVGTSRGFLWGRIDQIGLTFAVVHLKSSLGRAGSSDQSNAKKRELVMAAVAAQVNKARESRPGHAHLVAGDFNIGHTDIRKNGTDLFMDCVEVNCQGLDRYDDTHALLGAGLVGGLRMHNLALAIPDTTFPSFPGTPIDNIYVTERFAGRFTPAIKATDTFGSDHLAVSTVYSAPGN